MGFLRQLQGLLKRREVQLGAIALLLIRIGYESLRLKYSVRDLDVWWQLKVGDWIIANHAVPHTGIFSRTAGDRPWMAYSWGYEVLLSFFYRMGELLGVGIYGTLLTLLVAVSIYWMVRRLSGSFWFALVLTYFTCYPVVYSIMPRPVFFTEILFCIVIALILEAHRSGRIQLLYWLPAIFLLWANLHIQFIYGLFLVGVFVATQVVHQLYTRFRSSPSFLVAPTLPADRLMLILAACLVATCIGPYWYHVYEVILTYSGQKYAYARIQEMQAINFRYSEHYVQLLMTAAGFFAVGWQKKLDPFKLVLLVACAIIGFRTARDTWFVVVPAAAIIADLWGSEREHEKRESGLDWAVLAVVVCLGLLLGARSANFNQRGLNQAMARTFPIGAVNYLWQNQVPGPLYNNLNWGGFLIWYMPPGYPVAIDGRNDLYGDEIDNRFNRTQLGDPSYVSDPYLNESGVVLLQRNLPLVEKLRSDSRFTLLYEDKHAVVFSHQKETETPDTGSSAPASMP